MLLDTCKALHNGWNEWESLLTNIVYGCGMKESPMLSNCRNPLGTESSFRQDIFHPFTGAPEKILLWIHFLSVKSEFLHIAGQRWSWDRMGICRGILPAEAESCKSDTFAASQSLKVARRMPWHSTIHWCQIMKDSLISSWNNKVSNMYDLWLMTVNWSPMTTPLERPRRFHWCLKLNTSAPFDDRDFADCFDVKHRYYCQRKESCTWQELLLRLLPPLFDVGLFVWRPGRIYLTARLRNKMLAKSDFPTRIDSFCKVVIERCRISSVNRRMGQRFLSIRPSELLCSQWQVAKQERKFSETTSIRVQLSSCISSMKSSARQK